MKFFLNMPKLAIFKQCLQCQSPPVAATHDRNLLQIKTIALLMT